MAFGANLEVKVRIYPVKMCPTFNPLPVSPTLILKGVDNPLSFSP